MKLVSAVSVNNSIGEDKIQEQVQTIVGLLTRGYKTEAIMPFGDGSIMFLSKEVK